MAKHDRIRLRHMLDTAEPMKVPSSARRQARLRAAPPGAKAKGPDGPARRLREQRRVHSWARRYESAREAIAFAHGKSRDGLDHDRMLGLALVKCIEIMGEAATRVSEQMRADHPTIPWADIVAMRHRLIHGYFEIDMDRVWDTVTKNLPPLITELEKIVESAA